MNFKHLFFAIACLNVSGTVMAQDKIFKSNGDVKQVKIRSVGARQIVYKHFDNPNGPDYTLPKDEVDKIRYENGTEETFNGGRSVEHGNEERAAGSMKEQMRAKYNPNIIAFAPIQFTEAGIAGFSFSYERAIDKNSIVAFYVPVIAEFNTNNNYNNYYGTPGNTTDHMFYLAPGIKLYPTGGFGTAKYAIGPSLVIGSGTKTDWNNYYSGYSIASQDHFLVGMIVNQSININPTPHLYLASELGLGFTYVNQLGGINQGTGGLVQFNFKIGYRF